MRHIFSSVSGNIRPSFPHHPIMNLYYRALYVFLVSALIFSAAEAKDTDAVTESAWAEIEKSVAAGDWNTADSLIVATLEQHPDSATDAMLLSNLGMIRYYAGKDSLALDALTHAHRAAPASVTILANRAKVLTSMGRAAEALADYDNIVQLDSTYSDAYLYRGLIMLYSGSFEDALSDLQQREKLSPRSEDTLIALASFYTITENHESAISYYSRLIQADPQPEYYAGRAMCALRLERLVDASEDIADGLDLDPDYSELYLCRAILNKKRYCTADAHADADRALSLGANLARIKALLDF